MAGAYAALVSVMTVIDNLQLHPRPPISLHTIQAESLTQHLTFLEEFLQSYDQNHTYSTEADPLETRIADAAYAAEDAIESHIVDRILGDGEGTDAAHAAEDAIESHIEDRSLRGRGRFWWMCCGISDCTGPPKNKDPKSKQDGLFYHSLAPREGIISSSDASLYEALEKVIQEMEFIQKEAIAIKQIVGVQHQLHAEPMPLRSSSVAEKRSMVGADDLLLQMKDKLVSDRRDRQIIPIVGMGGTGKTTLAINIYQDPLTKEHFHIRAWATISQEYSVREILIEVLSQLNIEVDKHLSEDALGEILYKHLFGRKYLIVMDDMWSIHAWDGIRLFLPDNKNGSRIVITTRLSKLLSKIVFRGEGCPFELEDIGKEIGKSCKGLPLSIVVVGGFLAKSKHTREFWKHIEENLSIIVNLEDYERCLKILHMSYEQLPIYLKPCFLYMGVFPQDGVIRISKLIKLWVAEGFLKPINGRSLEEIAKVYLKDLADRNLVLIDKMGLTGNIKSCKIHDLLRDLCLREAEKERFYTLKHQGIVNGQRRIVISSTTSKNKDINALLSMSLVRSLIWNLEDEELPPLSLRLLRILDSRKRRSTPCTKFVDNVHQLVNSRYLQFAAPTLELEFPLSMWKFWNLQTLIVARCWHDVNAPIDIWYMPHIRHLLFLYGIALPDPPKDQDAIVLGNLQTLAAARNFRCSDQVVKRIPNIKKLKAYYVVGSLDDDRDCFTNLDRLDKLESLNYTIYQGKKPSGTVSLESLINFPHSLKKLCLKISESGYWETVLLDKIGLLPFLEKLQLRDGRFKDGQWETKEGQFNSLKFLYLHCCENLQVWTIERSHFPCLSNLRLFGLSNLEEIPLEFAEVSTLRVIDLERCTDSAVVSAERILENYEELHGVADLQVDVTRWVSNQEEKAAMEILRRPNFRVSHVFYIKT